FFNYVSNDNINFKQHHATLLSRISKITNVPNSSRAINQSKEILTNINDPFAFDDDNELDDYELDDYDHNPMNTNENIKTDNKRKRWTTSHLNSSNINKSIIDDEEVLNKAVKRWRQSNRRGHGHYAKTLETSIMNNLKNSLIIYSSNINDALLILHLSVVYWLNISIGLLLLIKFVRETYRPALMTTPLLVDILSFINNWISGCNRLKPPKKTVLN
ncbi:unnamed protein product, partial [Rotaria magnacalcarata]